MLVLLQARWVCDAWVRWPSFVLPLVSSFMLKYFVDSSVRKRNSSKRMMLINLLCTVGEVVVVVVLVVMVGVLLVVVVVLFTQCF